MKNFKIFVGVVLVAATLVAFAVNSGETQHYGVIVSTSEPTDYEKRIERFDDELMARFIDIDGKEFRTVVSKIQLEDKKLPAQAGISVNDDGFSFVNWIE